MTTPPGGDASEEKRPDAGERIVLYDGVCNLCNASVRFIINRDPHKRYRFAHLQSPAGKRLSKQRGIDSLALSSFILIAQNRTLTKSEAWLSILDSLGGIWRAARVFRMVPRSLRDTIYDLVGRWRYSIFGRTTHCQLPDPGARERFLDSGQYPQGHDS